MIELYQAEWCPYSSRVRQRLTELGVDYVARQVPPDRDDRDELERVVGSRGIPALVLEDGTAISETDRILEHLDTTFDPGPEAERHHARAAEHGM